MAWRTMGGTCDRTKLTGKQVFGCLARACWDPIAVGALLGASNNVLPAQQLNWEGCAGWRRNDAPLADHPLVGHSGAKQGLSPLRFRAGPRRG